jgi:hypothetical protein
MSPSAHEFEQKFLLVAAMANMPDLPGKIMSVPLAIFLSGSILAAKSPF